MYFTASRKQRNLEPQPQPLRGWTKDKVDLEVAHKKVQALQTTFLFGWQAELLYFSTSPS